MSSTFASGSCFFSDATKLVSGDGLVLVSGGGLGFWADDESSFSDEKNLNFEESKERESRGLEMKVALLPL